MIIVQNIREKRVSDSNILAPFSIKALLDIDEERSQFFFNHMHIRKIDSIQVLSNSPARFHMSYSIVFVILNLMLSYELGVVE